MTELKPCPFCGGNAKLARDVTCGYETFWAFCTDCHAQANYGHSEAEAARTWNVRADDQSQAAAYGHTWRMARWNDDSMVSAGELVKKCTEDGTIGERSGKEGA